MPALTQVIAEEIAREEAIPFSRFMELALYHAEHGYYERHAQQIGCQGDYYTNVSAGPLFGELLAFQFAEWLEEEISRKVFEREGAGARGGCFFGLIEGGAHDGQLAEDILRWLQACRPALQERITYGIIEPSERRQQRQEAKLHPYSGRVKWFKDWSAVPPVCGVIFSNELLDAFPVRRFGWDASRKEWFEWGVIRGGGKFLWTRLALSSGLSPILSEMGISAVLRPELAAVLPDKFTFEFSSVGLDWWRRGGEKLVGGKLVAIDYGLEAADFFRPERAEGTLRSYQKHRTGDDPLPNPGEQDLTVHVNFTALTQIGEKVGLRSDELVPQYVFLTRVAQHFWKEGSFGRRKRREFLRLVHPEHLGRAFKVLVQSRG
jgi:SAM-dependent MidA family methyltransferase